MNNETKKEQPSKEDLENFRDRIYSIVEKLDKLDDRNPHHHEQIYECLDEIYAIANWRNFPEEQVMDQIFKVRHQFQNFPLLHELVFNIVSAVYEHKEKIKNAVGKFFDEKKLNSDKKQSLKRDKYGDIDIKVNIIPPIEKESDIEK